MSVKDADLLALQQVRDLVSAAAEAQKRFAGFRQDQVDAVVDAMAEAATRAAESLARHAVEETGMGLVADKVKKNLFTSQDVHRAIRPMPTVGLIREDTEKGIREYAEPVGVVAAIIPTTNPTSTAIYKTLITIKARNGIVISPHPNAKGCICATADVLIKAATKAGAPEGLIGCLNNVSAAATQDLMTHRDVSLILATGGKGLVRAAYSSGKPAYGVGPGNVPAVIERSADVRKAVRDIVTGKTFDYGTICSSEQAIVTEESLREPVLQELRGLGAYFLSRDEMKALEGAMFRGDSRLIDPKVVGRSPQVIAELAGFTVPPETTVLVAELSGVGRDHPLSAEKLSPILGFYTAANFNRAVDLANQILEFGGLGHTASIHSNNDAAIREYGLRIRAYRVVVNSPSAHGSIGASTKLFPAMTLGCGAPGNNITSDNIGPQHLMNIKRVAFEMQPVESRIQPLARPAVVTGKAASKAPATTTEEPRAIASSVGTGTLERGVIARVVERFLQQKGVTPTSVVSPTSGRMESNAPTPTNAATPSAIPIKPAPPPAEFVSEQDVRDAVERGEKIHLSASTILTPSARDLGAEHDVFVEPA